MRCRPLAGIRQIGEAVYDNPVSWLVLLLFVVYLVARFIHAAFSEINEIRYEYYREERKK